MTDELLKTLQAEIGALKTDLDTLRREKDALAQQLTDAQTRGQDARVVQLQDKLDALEAEITEVKAQLIQKTHDQPSGGPHAGHPAPDPTPADDGGGFGFFD